MGTCPDGCPAPRLMMRVSHSEKNRLTKCDSSVLVDACKRTVHSAVSGRGNMLAGNVASSSDTVRSVKHSGRLAPSHVNSVHAQDSGP